VAALVRHAYTANVRELEALLLEALARRTGPELLPPSALAGQAERAATPGSQNPEEASAQDVGDAQLPPPDLLQQCLDRHGGKIELAWRELGLSSRHVLVRLIARHGLRAGRSWRPPGR
jgi:DNA-binding NtrC family response regulator